MKKNCHFLLLGAVLGLSACSTSNEPAVAPAAPAPVSKPASVTTTEATRMKIAGEKDWRPPTHQVLKGDTLYSIAFYYGLDYHEIAELNGIQDPRVIQVGQLLRLFPSAAKPALDGRSVAEIELKDQPKVVKYVYNDAALAKIDSVQISSSAPQMMIVPGAKVEVVSLHKAEPQLVKAESAVSDTSLINTEEDTLQWVVPTQGKTIGQFSEAANRKGIDIGGKLGQNIVASAPGKVVYSGSGLRGYGKLIIIKHNKTYLSAYAHNDKLMVKEGQQVKRGEKIAEMGKTDADQVNLHFEIRRLGKPVDPVKYLPKS